MFNVKNIYNKASAFISEINEDSISKISKDSKDAVQRNIIKYGVDKKIDMVKKETILIKDSISKSAKEAYYENEEILKKPVGAINEFVETLNSNKETLKWVGGIAIGIMMPVTTIVAGSIFYLLSTDEEKKAFDKANDETSDELFKNNNSKLEDIGNIENIPELYITENEWIKITINTSNKTADGVILKGNLSGQTFESLGVDSMKLLAEKLPAESESAAETKILINYWISWQSK